MASKNYETFFLRNVQYGGSNSKIGPVYRNYPRFQKGKGLSDVFSRVLRFISPYLISSSKAIGSEFARSGAEILENLGEKSIQDLIKDQKEKSLKNLAKKSGRALREISQPTQMGSGVDHIYSPSTYGLPVPLQRRKRAIKRKAPPKKSNTKTVKRKAIRKKKKSTISKQKKKTVKKRAPSKQNLAKNKFLNKIFGGAT